MVSGEVCVCVILGFVGEKRAVALVVTTGPSQTRDDLRTQVWHISQREKEQHICYFYPISLAFYRTGLIVKQYYT